MKAIVCQQLRVVSRPPPLNFHEIAIGGWASKEMTQWWPECHRIFQWHSFMNICRRARGNSVPCRRMSFTLSFLNWSPSLPAYPCSVLDLAWASLAFAGNARHLPTWIVTDFTSSILLLPRRRRGSAHHLLIVTVLGISIRGCLPDIAVSPMTIVVSLQELSRDLFVIWSWCKEITIVLFISVFRGYIIFKLGS